MQVRKSALFSLIFSSLIFVVSACNVPTNSSTPTSSAPVQVTTIPTTSAPDPKQQGVSPVNLPQNRSDNATDINSSVDAKNKTVPGGDQFVNNLFERPFNANSMDTYFPYIDIVDTQGFLDNTWGYATITLSGTDANGQLPAKYGVELDLDKDGRGDWLIIASKPSSTNWSTQGVQAWNDSNGDVGGALPLVADKVVSTGDGYETLVFDQGKSSSNPDGAWARISPDDNKTVQLAFKLSMLGSPKSYAMGAWAGSDLNPAMFDYNDHMTHLQAGDPDPKMQLYPIKGLSEIDNTCRLAIGFTPIGKEPGLCTIAPHRNNSSSDGPPPPSDTGPHR
jgi:hypothetical protein